MEFKDYYKSLEIDKKASNDDIKKAYRKLAQKYHPDKNKGDSKAEEKFKDISEAYEVLKDPEKRAKYDRLGSSYKNYSGQSRGGGGFDWSEWYNQNQGHGQRGRSRTVGDMFDDGGGLSDFFEKIFGGMGGGGRQRYQQTPATNGKDLETTIEISFDEAYNGTQRQLRVNGSSIKLNINAGIETGQTLKITGKGYKGANGGKNGNLIVKINVNNDSEYEIAGTDLKKTAKVDYLTMILGGKAMIDTPKGKINMSIPQLSQSGKIMKLKGLGMPVYKKNDSYGDLYIELIPSMPKELSSEQKELFEKIKSLQ